MKKTIKSITISVEFSFDSSSWEQFEEVDYIVTRHYKEGDENEVKEFTWTQNFEECLEFLGSIGDSYVLAKSLDKFKSAIWHSDAYKYQIDEQLEKLADFRKEKVVSFADLQGDRHIKGVSFKDCFEYDDYHYPYGYSVTFSDGSVLEKKNVSLSECILVMKRASKDILYKIPSIKEDLANTIFKVYNHDVNTRYRWRGDDLGEVEMAYLALPVFPYSYEMEYYKNKYVICKSAITGEVLWEKAGQCANGLIEIAQKDPDNYNHCVLALKDAVDNIYEEPYRTYAHDSIEKAEETVASLKEKSEVEKAARPVFTKDDIDDIATLDDTYTYDVEQPGFYGDVYYRFGFPKSPRHNLKIGLGYSHETKKTTDYKDFEPLFDKILEVSGDSKLVVKLCQPDDFGFETSRSYSDTCNRMEMIYLRAKYAKTRMECKNLTVELHPFCKPVIKYNGENLTYGDLFFNIPLEERHACFLQVIKELRKLTPDSIVYWFPRFEALYKESIAEGFANLDRELLKFSVDEVKSFHNASTWTDNWVSYADINIVGSLELNGEKITSESLYALYKEINRDKFWGIYNSISLLSKYIDKKVFAQFPKMIVEPLTWAPEGVIKIEKPEFTGYLEKVTSKGSFMYRLVNCDPVSSAEVTLEFVLNLFSEETIEAASEFTLKSGWDGTLVRDRDWSNDGWFDPSVFGTLTQWSSGSDSNSKMFFLPYVIIKYRGWKYLQSRGWNESDEIRIHKKETAYLDSYGVLRVLRNKQMEATMESRINRWIRDSKPDKSYSSDQYLTVMDPQTWKSVKSLLNENLFTCIADRFNCAKIWYNIVKEVCDGRDLYWDIREFNNKYDSWYKTCTSFDFSDRTICYKRVVDGKIIEETRKIKISPADRVRDLVELGRTREDALGVVMPLWHRYKFEFQVSMVEFTGEIDFNGKTINVRKKPVKVNIPKFIEVPARSFYGNNLNCSFASGSLYYLCSSLLGFSSHTKLSEFYLKVKMHVTADGAQTEVTDYATAANGYFRLEVDQKTMHRFLINHSIWHLNNSHVAKASVICKTDGEHDWTEMDVHIANPRSVEVINLVDFDKGWGSSYGDKLRYWHRAFVGAPGTAAPTNIPVLTFPSREVMRITLSKAISKKPSTEVNREFRNRFQ